MATLAFTSFFLNELTNALSKLIAELLQLAMRLFRMTLRVSNEETSCIHEASDSHFN
jgi:hypothetical protein